MSSGTVHLRASLVLAAGFSVGALISQDARLLECTLGALTGIMLSPDLDVDAKNISSTIIKKKIGWLGVRIWDFFWKGYRTSFKHGQFASHFPVFGTFVRLSYAYFLTIFIPHTLIYFLFSPAWSLMYVSLWYAKLFLSPLFFYGLASSDTVHYFLDIFITEHKT